jgi:cobalt-zinc-cadmium efflux system outer membrane protein
MDATRPLPILRATALLAALAAAAHAQGPSFDPEPPPGAPNAVGGLGRPIGASGISSLESPGSAQDRPIGGRAGPSVSRAPVGGLNPPGVPRPTLQPERLRPATLEPASLPTYGELDLPPALPPRDQGALSLDTAIELLLRQNLRLIALRYEIPMAQADVLTAGLRANPIFYADTQLQPYGQYSDRRPGGPPQYDINLTLPIDVTRKRLARRAAAQQAHRVVEAQLQDAARIEIDNLYTAYVDVVAADETLRFSRAYATGISRLLQLNEDLLAQGQVDASIVEGIRAQSQQSALQVREAEQAVGRTRRTLARLLNLPPAEADALRVAENLRDLPPVTVDPDAVRSIALATRPDLAAFRLGIERAHADARLARAERFSDVYLLAQPYTFQDNSPFGHKSAHSWALGVTVPLPVFNRNQGNIARADLNVAQTHAELAAVERQVADEVHEALLEFQLSRDALDRIERDLLPTARNVRDAALRRLRGGEINALQYLEAERNFNEVVRLYRDALVRHRRAMLDLNTAAGTRLLP